MAINSAVHASQPSESRAVPSERNQVFQCICRAPADSLAPATSPADSFAVRIEPRLPRDLEKRVARVRKVRAEAEALQREAAAASAEVASDLVAKVHMTVRDAGRVLGLSYQRIAQLIKPAASGPPIFELETWRGQLIHPLRPSISVADLCST
jgi:hypothetical protein